MRLFQIPRKRDGLTAILALFWFLSIAFPAHADTCNFSLRGADQMCTLTWNNLSRQYLLHVHVAECRVRSAASITAWHSVESSMVIKGPCVSDVNSSEDVRRSYRCITAVPFAVALCAKIRSL
jgi:hypothetical protein